MDKNFIIHSENVQEDFTDHLTMANNTRILFSGRFGVGKTHFLEKYFAQFENLYDVFWINPINYVLGNNEDIFEWIKIDLAKQLLNNYFEDQQAKKSSNNFFIQAYVYSNASSLFNKLISYIGNQYLKTASSLDFLDIFAKNLKDFKSYKAKLSKKIKTDNENLHDFLTESPYNKKSVYEDDLTTSIISTCIKQLQHDTGKSFVMIIDDLDRMDPEHIFRLLNIFSAQNDNARSKFSFNKIIFACDISNIEHLYKHKYGLHADFEGYIEKFYSIEPFHFTINDAIIDFCSNDLSFLQFSKPSINTLSVLLSFFASHNYIRIRDLKRISLGKPNKVKNKEKFIKKIKIELFSEENDQLVLSSFFEDWNFQIDFREFEIIDVFKVITIIFGGTDKFVNLLDVIIAEKETVKETFNHQVLPDVFESLAILSHIAKWKDTNSRNIFLTWLQVSDDALYKEFRAVGPTLEFFGVKYKLPIKWSEMNYYENGHFFEGALPKEGIKQLVNEDSQKKACQIINLIIETRDVLKFLTKEKML